MKHVMFITGIRSEYDILSSVIKAVDATPGMRASVVVTGAHLSPMYGYSVREVERDGVRIVARLESLLNSDSRAGRVKSAAIQMSGLVDIFVNEQPDFVVSPMDREEAITVALAGAYLGIPVVHIGGGDTADDANIDNSVRHAATKLSHLHMVTTSQSAARVIALGEEAWRVHVVGAAGLDRLRDQPTLSDEEFWPMMEHRPDGPFAVVIQHSTITSAEAAGEYMRLTLQSLVNLSLPCFVSYPNTDAGGQKIIEVLGEYAARFPELIWPYRNLSRAAFVNLMRRAAVLVGNSSAGIIEAPMFALPTVNIGERQRGREHSENVVFVDHDIAQIEAAVRRAAFSQEYREQVRRSPNIYGDGRTGQRIAAILRDVESDQLVSKLHVFNHDQA